MRTPGCSQRFPDEFPTGTLTLRKAKSKTARCADVVEVGRPQVEVEGRCSCGKLPSMSEWFGRRLSASLRRTNRSPRLVELARRTRERALGDDDLIDHLSTARGRPSDLAARQLVSLRGERPGFAGELGLTALQAWQRLAEKQDRGRGKVDVAILFTDLVGFSSWALEAGDRAAVQLLREVGEAIEPPVLERQGEVVKRLGDGL